VGREYIWGMTREMSYIGIFYVVNGSRPFHTNRQTHAHLHASAGLDLEKNDGNRRRRTEKEI